MNVGCVLLAAGAGKRFGGNKLAYEMDGVSLLARALRLYGEIPFLRRVCVVRPEDEAAFVAAQDHGFTPVINPDPDRGVGTSVALGTQKLASLARAQGALYAVCDQPWLTRDSVMRLLAAFEQDPTCIVSLSCKLTRGNPAVFPASLFGELKRLDGDIGGGAVIRRHPVLLKMIEANHARELIDLDARPQA